MGALDSIGASNSQRAAEQAARLAYGRIVATLCQQGVTIEAAEDALHDAFVRALTRWPNHGVPDSPDAWLLTAARRILIDHSRHTAVVQRAHTQLVPLIEQLETQSELVGDRRLNLMMLCAHPAIAANARAPLMLQTVLGLSVRQMSSAFVLSPATLGQRLARAKTSIRGSKLPYDMPEASQHEQRTSDVLEAIYAAFSTGYELIESAKDIRHGLAHEAIWLGQILVQEMPDLAEARGLQSLMLFVQARVEARRDEYGEYRPLSNQDRTLWNWQYIATAEHHLRKAYLLKKPGRFQIEAAIQSHHMQNDQLTGPDWSGICTLYDALVARNPTLAAWVGRAAAIGEAHGPANGLAAITHISTIRASEKRLSGYQPYWAVKAHLHARNEQYDLAKEAYNRAIGLCEDKAVCRYLVEQKNRLD